MYEYHNIVGGVADNGVLEDTDGRLNELAAQGWRVVHVVLWRNEQLDSGKNAPVYLYVMEREIKRSRKSDE